MSACVMCMHIRGSMQLCIGMWRAEEDVKCLSICLNLALFAFRNFHFGSKVDILARLMDQAASRILLSPPCNSEFTGIQLAIPGFYVFPKEVNQILMHSQQILVTH